MQKLIIAGGVGVLLSSLVWVVLLYKGAFAFTVDPFDVFTTLLPLGQ